MQRDSFDSGADSASASSSNSTPVILKETGLQKQNSPHPTGSAKSGSAAVTGCPERATVALGPTAVRDKPVIPNQAPASSAEHALAPLQWIRLQEDVAPSTFLPRPVTSGWTLTTACLSPPTPTPTTESLLLSSSRGKVISCGYAKKTKIVPGINWMRLHFTDEKTMTKMKEILKVLLFSGSSLTERHEFMAEFTCRLLFWVPYPLCIFF